ncbi:prepilin-type N-terminal cleavage/methylation domain-containing protein [Pigmentiphaga litoralis]|uniref:type 4 pilus major pilin n=1 Tax=Pigmentiphaga litoralis TaxID=516702 RepID=UPI001675512B|nr:type 4 pilus major pilin [Pigmentiphaga litoralis]GGX31923.1 prepilin-type N-terminal cleavage/methylation domain-containing protein [Pigmentiphaga litoralis]
MFFPSSSRPGAASPRRQQGFTLVEIAIVAAIILIAAILGIPAINGYIIENKVPSVGQELQRFVARSKSSTQGLGPTPYTGIGMAQLANGLRSSSVLTVEGQGANATVRHGLGATDGMVVLSPGGLTAAGDAFTLTFTRVNEAACPGLAAVLQRVSERIQINGTTVKEPAVGGATGIYDATGAEALCTGGDSNRFVFTAR